MKKFELTEETLEFQGVVLHRIKALKDFSDVKAGDLGGWVEKEENLSHSGACWIYDDARVYGNAIIYNNAKIFGMSIVSGNARVYGNAKVREIAIIGDNAEVHGNAKIYGCSVIMGYASICGNTEIRTNEDYIVFKNNWSSFRYFTWTKSNDKWKVGCFYGTGEELIKKAYKDDENCGKHYKMYVKFVEKLKRV